MFVGIYGYLDAILRFPSVPRLESFFAVKLLISVIAKTVLYAIGFIHIDHWTLPFLSALFLNVWLLPVLYVMLLPLGDSSPFRMDRDMLISLFYIVAEPKDRDEAFHSLRLAWWGLKKRFGTLRTISVSPKRGSLLVALDQSSPMRSEISLKSFTI